MLYRDPVGIIEGIYRDNGKENGNYHSIFGCICIEVIWQRFSGDIKLKSGPRCCRQGEV